MGVSAAHGLLAERQFLTSGPPSADEQIALLRYVQRIFSEGSFFATCEYALLHALADLASLGGDDSGVLLLLSTHGVAERFGALYWVQGVLSLGQGRVRQNIVQPAVILNRVEDVGNRPRGSLARLRRHESARCRLVLGVAHTVRLMPLRKLQMVGSSSRSAQASESTREAAGLCAWPKRQDVPNRGTLRRRPFGTDTAASKTCDPIRRFRNANGANRRIMGESITQRPGVPGPTCAGRHAQGCSLGPGGTEPMSDLGRQGIRS